MTEMALAERNLSKTAPLLVNNDFLRFGRIVEERSGLNFAESRRPEFEQGLRQAFAASTCPSLDSYYRLLQDPQAGALEMARLVNALTVGETHFFRDAGQFDALFHQVLPRLIERRRPIRTLRIWSAGCASGEEPYSIAMMLRQLIPDVDEWAITILGTDINHEALARAREAVYGDWAFREERARQVRRRFFRRQGSRYALIPAVRRMVTFAQMNLAGDEYPSIETNTTLMDLVLCRNVTIYFGAAVTKVVVERLYHALADGGWLLVGHSEPSPYTYRRFRVHNFPNAVLYQRATQAPLQPQDWNWLPTVYEQAIEKTSTPAGGEPPPRPPSPIPEEGPEREDPLACAQEFLAYGRSRQARDLLLEVVHEEPAKPVASALLGQACANLGLWIEAEAWCRQAIRLDKLALEAYYTLALVLQHQGYLDDAIDAMKKVVYIDRRHILGHFGLANLYRNKGELAQAQKSLDNAWRLLETCAPEVVIPGASGINAGQLKEAVDRQRKHWGDNGRHGA
jgi:chemotaxis protein methyltransferase CheR